MMDSLSSTPDWLSIAFQIFNFLFSLAIDITILIIAIKGYKTQELKRTWLFLIFLISISIITLVYHSLFYTIFPRVFTIENYKLWFMIVSFISTILGYIHYILFLLMVIWLFKKK